MGGGNPFKHVVVLMCENRSFDHMLGFLKTLQPSVDGLNGNETNPYTPSDPNSATVTVSPDAGYITFPDAGHSVQSTNTELFGGGPVIDPAPMNGFVLQYDEEGDPANGANIMKCFSPSSTPTINTLAQQFATFDHWYASVPGPTQPNRMFVHACTSKGNVDGQDILIFDGFFNQRTIYDNLDEAGIPWNIYFSDWPLSLCLAKLRSKENLERYRTMLQFLDDCKKGTLPSYSFIEPRYFAYLAWNSTDQHPDHNVAYGEFLFADIYEAIRANQELFESTLFIITYDEHGGFYDHVSPPATGIPNPDGKNSINPPFDFNRLGLRLPCVMVSPWIPAGTVIHEPSAVSMPTSTSHFEHSSVAATLKHMFNMSPPFLTKRDAWAATFDTELELVLLDAPRTDCPMTLPRPPLQVELQMYNHAESIPETPETVKWAHMFGLARNTPLLDLQREALAIAQWAADDIAFDIAKIKTEHEGAVYVRHALKRVFEKFGLPCPAPCAEPLPPQCRSSSLAKPIDSSSSSSTYSSSD